MSATGLVQILEGALLAAGKPLTVVQMTELFEEHGRPDKEAIREALAEIARRCDDRGFELAEVASGFRFQVRQELSPWVARLWHERPQKYSRALLETLALIAYRQPITRGEIEEIRGVAVSSNIIKTLHEREWIRVVGHRDVPGRPAMYATTRQFLDYFNLKSLEQLPALAEIRDLETLNAELGFNEPLPQGPGSATNAAGQTDTEISGEEAAGPGLMVVGGRDHRPVGTATGAAESKQEGAAEGEDGGEAAGAPGSPGDADGSLDQGLELSLDELAAAAGEAGEQPLAARGAVDGAAEEDADSATEQELEPGAVKPESQG
jgi:segregation and condensation protein B